MTEFLQLVVVGLLDGVRVRARRDEPRARLPDDRDRQLRARRLRGDRRTVHVPALRRPAARARDARRRSCSPPSCRRSSPWSPSAFVTGRRASRARSSPSAPRFWRRRCSCSSSATSRAAIGASPTGVEHRRRPRPAAVRAHRSRRDPLRRRADRLPPPNDRRTGARRVLGLAARRRARRPQHPLARSRRVCRRRRSLRARRRAARAEQPDDVQLGRRDHRQRLRRGRVRRTRLDPPRAARRLCARDPRAARGRVRRPAVQPDHRPDRHARPHRLALAGGDRERVARRARCDPARPRPVAGARPNRR